MADQFIEVTKTIIGPARITDLGARILVTPAASESSLNGWRIPIKFPKSDSRVQSLLNMAQKNAAAGGAPTGTVSLKLFFQCSTKDSKANPNVDPKQCSLNGFKVDLLHIAPIPPVKSLSLPCHVSFKTDTPSWAARKLNDFLLFIGIKLDQ